MRFFLFWGIFGFSSQLFALEVTHLPFSYGAVMSRNGDFVIASSTEDPRQAQIFSTQLGSLESISFSEHCDSAEIRSISDSGDLIGLNCLDRNLHSMSVVSDRQGRAFNLSQVLNPQLGSHLVASSASGLDHLSILHLGDDSNSQQSVLWKLPEASSPLSNLVATNISDDGSNLWGFVYESQSSALFYRGSEGNVRFGNGTFLQPIIITPNGKTAYGYSYTAQQQNVFRYDLEEGYQEVQFINEALPPTTYGLIGVSNREERLAIQVRLRGRPQIDCMIVERGKGIWNLKSTLLNHGFAEFSDRELVCEQLSSDGRNLLVRMMGPGPGFSSQQVLVRLDPFCRADFNDDGGVDGTDAAEFFRSFEAGHQRADIDENGAVDGSDISAYFQIFETGC